MADDHRSWILCDEPLSQRLFFLHTKPGTHQDDGKALPPEGSHGVVFRSHYGCLPALMAVDQPFHHLEDGLFAAYDQDIECCCLCHDCSFVFIGTSMMRIFDPGSAAFSLRVAVSVTPRPSRASSRLPS